MKIYSSKSVYEKGLQRMNWLFDEFDNIIVSYSGGKDSTIIFELAMKVATERNRLPLKVFFIDQEAEWNHTIDMVKEIMYRKDVEPLWFQIPIKIENSTTFSEVYQNCWGVGEEWIRPKDPVSRKENIYGCEKWTDGIFSAISKVEFKDKRTAYVGGVRSEESPSRKMALTESLTYKYVTWGKILVKEMQHYTFYPIYDWSYTDVWKAIHENKWKYNKIYDFQYQQGVAIPAMRVSNLHHETAVASLFYLQEVDHDLYNALVKRMPGIDAAGKSGKDDFFVKSLPFMFKDWSEYRDYLAEKLITDEGLKKKIKHYSEKWDALFVDNKILWEKASKCIVSSIITGDIASTKMKAFNNTHGRFYERWLIKQNESITTS